jgi:D-arabinose 1-dehydrogenase-like Zn-dependent alcohol dehydrogenase
MGHEFLGVVEDVGADVTGLKPGDLVVTPFVWADNTCDFCTQGLQTSCRHGGRYGLNGVDGGQGEAVGVPPKLRARWSSCPSTRTRPCWRRC